MTTNDMLPYEQLKRDFEEAVRDKDIFESPKIKIIRGQTGLGKSYYQDNEMPVVLKEVFPELQYIIRVSPTTEVANDGTFKHVNKFSKEGGTHYFYCSDPSTDSLKQWGQVPDAVICISTTHSYFAKHFDIFKELASKSVIIIEEAHQYVGCGDEGSVAYVTNYGYSTPYAAKTVQLFFEWAKINPRIIGFTATVTAHHKGDVSLTDRFHICNDMQKKRNLIASQAWLNTTNPFHFAKKQGYNSIAKAVQQSIETIFLKESQLQELKFHDSRINTKLTGLYLAGTNVATWGCPIDQTRESITEYLRGCNFDGNDKMIATMTENGIRVFDLYGNSETIPNNDSSELIKRLEDPDNELRFVIVVNRARSGINVHNFSTEVVCRLRDPKEIKTLIPIQMFGRMVRINVGTGSIIRKEYKNNIEEYLLGYCEKYDVPMNVVIDTIKVANTFDIWFPTNDDVQRTWEESIVHFKKEYVNMKNDGYYFLSQFEEGGESSFVPFPNLEIDVTCPCDGKTFKVNVNEEVTEWKGNGTLDAFFNIA